MDSKQEYYKSKITHTKNKLAKVRKKRNNKRVEAKDIGPMNSTATSFV